MLACHLTQDNNGAPKTGNAINAWKNIDNEKLPEIKPVLNGTAMKLNIEVC